MKIFPKRKGDRNVSGRAVRRMRVVLPSLLFVTIIAGVIQLFFSSSACARFHEGDGSSAVSSVAIELPEQVDRCVSCHLNAGMQPEYRDEDGSTHNLHIDPAGYVGSIHYRNGKQLCSDCHEGDYTQYPHPASNTLPSCLDCHEEIRQEYEGISRMAKASIHFTTDQMGTDCGTCHSPHEMIPAREMSVEQKNAACIECHEDEYNPSGLSLVQRHNWHPQAALHLSRVSCLACHTEPDGTDLSFRHRILPKEKAVSDCYACHGVDNRMANYIGSFDHGVPQTYDNSDLVREYYVSGATRTPMLDIGGLAFMALVVLGVLGHGILRIASARGMSTRGLEKFAVFCEKDEQS